MALSNSQKEKISTLLKEKIEEKLQKYARETVAMPFLNRLIQDDERVAAYSFIHSLITTLGMSIYEPVSKIIAEECADECCTQYDVEGKISPAQGTVIDEIVRDLRNDKNRQADSKQEMKKVIAASTIGGTRDQGGEKADLYMRRGGVEHYFEIKTAKPNMSGFADIKRQLLKWVARRGKEIRVFVAIPYNPYDPKPYKRFTALGFLERGRELLIGKEYWDFLGGEGTYEDLLVLFDEVGKELKGKIAAKIREVAKTKTWRFFGHFFRVD